jgi:hypothetical protein
MGMTQDLELHVETLVVDGVSQADAVGMGQAFQRALELLLQRSNASLVLNDGRAIAPVLDASVSLSATSRSGDLGTAVARAVHEKLVP